jgi:hypothetical protein
MPLSEEELQPGNVSGKERGSVRNLIIELD